MAKGPALCSPLNGVGLVGSKWQLGRAAASRGLSNQKPTWNVFVGAKCTSGSKPKISLPSQTKASGEIGVFGAIGLKEAVLDGEQVKREPRLDAIQIQD